MPKRANPKTDLEKLKAQQKELAGEIKEAEKRLHLRLGKLVCETGADALDEAELRKLLKVISSKGTTASMALLEPTATAAPAQKKPAAEQAAEATLQGGRRLFGNKALD